MSLGQLPTQTGMSAYYKTEGNSNDSSGNAVNGTDTSITYVRGYFNQGAQFNGTSSYISLGTGLNLTNEISIRFWIKHPTGSPSTCTIINKGNRTNAASLQYQVGVQTDGTLRMSVSDGITITAISSIKTINDNLWHFVLAKFSGDNNQDTIQFDIDGKIDNTAASTIIAMQSTAKSVAIGRDGDLATRYLTNGCILSEIIIEPRFIFRSEMYKYYTQAKGRFCI